jgi:lysophospholipase
MPNDVPAAILSHDPAIAAAYNTDPLNHHVATARWGTEVFAAQERALARAGELKTPMLVLYASDDQIADPAATAIFFERVTIADKTQRCYEDYYHETFNEVKKEAVFRDIETWLAGRV